MSEPARWPADRQQFSPGQQADALALLERHAWGSMDEYIRGLETCLRRALEATVEEHARWEDELRPALGDVDADRLPRDVVEAMSAADRFAYLAALIRYLALDYGVGTYTGAVGGFLSEAHPSSPADLLRGLNDILWRPTATSGEDARGRDPDRLISKRLADCTTSELLDAMELAMVADTPARFLSDLLETIAIRLGDVGVEQLRELPDPDAALHRLVEERAAEHDLSRRWRARPPVARSDGRRKAKRDAAAHGRPDPRNADWTKANGLDWPGADAETVARCLLESGRGIVWLTLQPMYDRWLVVQPWLADVGVRLDALVEGQRRATARFRPQAS